ncbi:MAG: serine/threonine-protein phosphatase [Acidobacteriia bacterium]|nr:serine/threonine-protein phosphatase [Terriglobia bacterium]
MASSGYNHAPQDDPYLMVNAGAGKKRAKGPSKAEDLELRVATLERERREIHQELFEAAQVQRRLSGPRQLLRGRFEIASEIFPVRHLAGDFVSATDIGTRTWIALGDISGKGLAAAMWFTHLVSLIRCLATAHQRPAAVMRELNEDLCGLQPAIPYTSIVLLVLDCESGQMEYCNAGHPAPLALRRAGSVEKLEAGGPLLGVVSGAAYESARVELCPGDLLLGCTDGVLECRNAADEDFGHVRLVGEAREHAKESAQAVLFSVLGAVQDFAGEKPRHDDVSLLVIRPAEEFRA